MMPNWTIIYLRYYAKRGCILSSHILKSQRKSRNIKKNLSDRDCPKHYHMSHNYYRLVGNMSILSVEVIRIEGQEKTRTFFMGVGVIKEHLKQNMTQKAIIKSFIQCSRCLK